MPTLFNHLHQLVQLMQRILLSLVLLACGAPAKAPTTAAPTPSSTTPSLRAVSASTADTSDLGALPAMASMPARGVVGSRLATRKAAAAWSSCVNGISETDADALGKACAASTKTTKVQSLKATLEETNAHQEFKLKFDKGHCYRIYLGKPKELTTVSVTLRDSRGDIMIDDSAAAVPQDGALCMNESDTASLLVSAGLGKGAVTLSVWSD
jgi:hypothetical protein